MKKWMVFTVLGVFLCGLSTVAMAGVTPILPATFTTYTINNPGSYQLQGNIRVTQNITAIKVNADNVTIDLNGFAITGPTVCSGTPRVCTKTGTGIGIDANGHDNIKVTNGTISGMGNLGILARNNCIIHSVIANNNGLDGIEITSGILSGNAANGNGDAGISVLGIGTVSGNTANNNGGDGIDIENGIVSGNTADGNGGDGIDIYSGTVTGNTADGNGSYGLDMFPDVGYFNNELHANTSGNVTGGFSWGNNLCNGSIC